MSDGPVSLDGGFAFAFDLAPGTNGLLCVSDFAFALALTSGTCGLAGAFALGCFTSLKLNGVPNMSILCFLSRGMTLRVQPSEPSSAGGNLAVSVSAILGGGATRSKGVAPQMVGAAGF